MQIDVEVDILSGINWFIQYTYWVDGAVLVDHQPHFLWSKGKLERV